MGLSQNRSTARKWFTGDSGEWRNQPLFQSLDSGDSKGGMKVGGLKDP